MGIKKHFIFDFDGTLADTVPVIFTIVGELAQELGYDKRITEEDIEWVSEHKLMEIPKKFNIPLVKIPYLFMEGRKKLKAQMFSVPACKGIVEVLHELKKKEYSLGILSSNRRDTIQEFLLKYSLVDLFDFVHSELNLFGKDKALLSLFKEHNIQKESAVYIGDELRDIEACKKAGVDIISAGWGFNSPSTLKKENPNYIAIKPQDILTFIS